MLRQLLVPLQFGPVFVALLYGCGPPPHSTAQQPREVATGEVLPSLCVVREDSRERLIPEEGQQLYVEPMVLESSSQGDVLLAGTYNYLFGQTPEGKWTLIENDSIFGAVIRPDGPARIIFSPIPTKLLTGIRAVTQADGTWAVIFAEGTTWTGESRPDTAARLWYGVLDGTQWATLEPLPLPPAGTLRPSSMSSLIQFGDTLAWAMEITRPDHQRDIVVFQRHGGQWSFDTVRTTFTAYVDVAHSDSLGLILAVVRPDLTLPSDGNSLFLWARRPEWRELRKIVPSTTEEVHSPRLILSHAGDVLSWQAQVPTATGSRWEAHAMSGHLEEKNGALTVLDSAVTSISPVVTVRLPRGPRMWIVDHLLSEGPEREIRIIQDSGGSAVKLAQVPNPFLAEFAATLSASSEILVTGALIDRDQDVGVSLLLRFKVKCGADETL